MMVLLKRKIPPTHLQERQKVIDGIRYDGIRNRDIHFAESPHFIVVFKDTEPYKDFGAPGLEGPEDLAYYLEGGLKIATDAFGIETPDTFQVLQIKRGGRFMSMVHSGLHFGNREGQFKFKEWDHARFSESGTRGKSKALFTPKAYTVALHEAIGHGVLAPALLSEEGQLIPFLNEGLSTYIEYVASGRNPHDYLIGQMFDHGLEKFQNLLGEWKEMTPEQTASALTKQGISDISVANLFRLISEKEDVTKRDYASVKNGTPNHADYTKGGSFTKYFIDRFGVEAYKRWAGSVTRTGFVPSLEDATGLTLKEIESGWKQEVLKGFMTSPEITGKIEGGALEDQITRYEDAKRVRDIYLVHS